MISKPFRIAHLTDLHAAATWQPIIDAAAIVTAGIPALNFAVPMIHEAMHRLAPTASFSNRLLISVAGAAGTVLALSRSHKIRSMVKVCLAMMYQYNHSGQSRRRKLFKSLRENEVDHLIITGDLSITAHPAEFTRVCNELNEYGFDRDNTTVVPGNHDRVMFPRSESFETFFPEVSFPEVREVAPGVVVAGVDSNIPEGKWSLWDTITANTRGYIDPQEISELETKLDGITDETVVTGIHHLPVRRRQLTSLPRAVQKIYSEEPEHSHDLRKLLKKLRALVLCGHDHPRQSRIVQFDGLKFFQSRATGLRFQHSTTYDIYDLFPGRSIRRLTATV